MKQIIHIGANKTASTLLQRRLFSCHPAIAYLGEDCRDYSTLQPQLETLIQKDESYYDEARTKEIFDRTAAESGVMVFSSEDILTSPHPSVCAARLGRLMPGATVVIVLRNQLTTWPSWYINHGAFLKGVPRRYWKRHVGFAEWMEYCFAFPDRTPVEAMNYHRHVEIFSRVFGADRMRILLYEDLIQCPVDYFARWGEILGIPGRDVEECLGEKRERPRISHRRFLFERCGLASFLPVAFLKSVAGSWLDAGPAAHVNLPPEWIERIRAFYAPGNKAIEKATGLCLSHHGYPV